MSPQATKKTPTKSAANKNTSSSKHKEIPGMKELDKAAEEAKIATNRAAKSAKYSTKAASDAAKTIQDSAAKTTERAQQTAYEAAESTQRAAQNVINIGSQAMREMLSTGSGEASRAQEKVFEMGREGVANIARSCDMATGMLVEMANIYRDNMEAMIECCTVSAAAAQEINEEVAESCNRMFSEHLEICKDAFNCRTINDVMDLQNRAMNCYIDNCFEEAGRIGNIVYEASSDALEPINDRVSQASDQLCKAMAA